MLHDHPFRIDGTEGPTDLGPKYIWIPSKYEQAVQHHLGTIRGTETGRIVEKYILATGKTVFIRPDDSSKTPNARMDPRGGFIRIYFTPGHYAPGSVGIWAISQHTYLNSGRIVPNAIGNKPDEVLFHEIFHAQREAAGKRDPSTDDVNIFNYRSPTPDTTRRDDPRYGYLSYDDVEEFNAVLVANVYMSEKNNRLKLHGEFSRAGFKSGDYALRLDQTPESHVPLGKPHAFHLHPEIADLIRKLRSSQHALCEELALTPATFNPFRDLMMDENPLKVATLFLQKYNTLHRDYEFYQHALQRLTWKAPAAELKMLLAKYAP
jgi:hypothetical protein